jgi:hypothetical protein
MQCNLLKNIHPVIGVAEPHELWVPGSPIPAPAPVPHFTVAALYLGPWGALTGKPAPKVLCEGSITMQKGTDVGPGIPHLPPNLFLPIILIGSASKSYFGVSTVKAQGTAVAVALLSVANLNLDCAEGAPLPVGGVVAMNTVVAGLTLSDFLSGALTMAFECAVQAGLGKLLNKATYGSLLSKLQGKFMSKFILAEGEKVMVDVAAKSFKFMLSASAEKLMKTTVGLLIGSPLGLSAVNVPQKIYSWVHPDAPDSENFNPMLSPGGGVPGAVSDEIGKYFDGPSVEQFPSQPATDPQSSQ